jgi:hypothetical protein
MMESKQKLLKNLQRILDSQKNSKEIEELNDKYLKHKDEYIVLFNELSSSISRSSFLKRQTTNTYTQTTLS